MTNRMKTMSGQGADLRDLLMAERNIPRSSKWFEVRFGAGECVTVRCEFFAEERPDAGPAEGEEGSELHVPDHGGLNG